MKYQFVNFEVSENVALITLNRPDVLNSFNKPMGREVQAILQECSDRKDVRCVVITGAGRAFCAGQDLEEVTRPGVEIKSIVRETYNPLIRLITEIEKPVIALVNGVAAGAGANIALACDIVVASESAAFIQSFSKIGLIPDSGGTYTLPRLVGKQRATALMMLGEKLDAKSAEAWGMIWKAVHEEQLMSFGMDLAKKMAAMPTRGLGLTKKALALGNTGTLAEQLDHEEALQSEAGSTYDYREGVNAFLEKRKPAYRGE